MDTTASTMQTSQPITHISFQAGQRTAREIARIAIDGQLDLNPPYQRGTVWSTVNRLNLVRSWLSGMPVPAVVINARHDSRWTGTHDFGYAAVDGKQRIETAVLWFSGQLPVPASWFEADRVVTTIDTEDGPYVTFTGLTIEAQRHVSNRAFLPVLEVNVATVAEEAALFGLVNTAGVAQDADDLARARAVAGGV